MNVLILMAGPSAAFEEAGFVYPKNLIEVAGKPMIEHVIESFVSLKNFHQVKFFYLVRETENKNFHTSAIIHLLDPEASVISVPEETKGAACTSLLAVGKIEKDRPLVIINGDVLLLEKLGAIIHSFQHRDLDGGAVVFESVHPRWSYVKCNSEDLVIEASEKRPISRFATAGVYYYKKGKDYIEAAMSMLKKDAHVGGSFYVCPVFNEMLLHQKKIGIYKIPKEQYVSFASPQGVRDYEMSLRG